MEKLLRLPEVAELTGLPVNTLRFWRHQGTGPRSIKPADGSSTASATWWPGSRSSSTPGEQDSAIAPHGARLGAPPRPE